jgi:porphobilinogen synthase
MTAILDVARTTVSSIGRTRRLRRSSALRAMVRETWLRPEDLVYPLFVRHGRGSPVEIRSMPGIHQWTLDRLPAEVEAVAHLGVRAVILFGIPDRKDPVGEENFDPQGIVHQAVRAIKQTVPEMIVITDVCLCEYTDHGHCGLLNVGHPLPHPHLPEGYVLDDETLEILSRVAVSHVEVGADVVAPSGMIDGMVAALRDAAESPPHFGDRTSHQMDPANAREALREARLDVEEGADMLMVKPALAYLDVVRMIRQAFPEVPLAAYNVSGEYAMVKAAAAQGWIDERRVVLELLTGIKRAGADLILTYHAKDAAAWLRETS